MRSPSARVDHFAHILVGGGVAAGHALDALLKAGVAGNTIALVCSEPELPYHRPPLSKAYLLGRTTRAALFVKPPTFFTEKGVTVLLNTRVTGVHPPERTITLHDGRALSYGKLLLATGAAPRRLAVLGSDLENIFTLRTLPDSERIRDAMGRATTAVVVGGGFIGMELASACAQKGLRTTILHRGTAVFDRLGSADLSRFFAEYYTARGVDIRYEDEAVGFDGQGVVTAVRTKRGETLPADLVTVGIGVTPDVGFLEGSRIAVDNGITVNEYLETSAPDVYAGGDVANFYDPLYEKHRRIEHWDTAIQHGKVAGKNMAGSREPYGAVSYFFSEIFDLSFDYFGDAEGTDTVIQRGSFDERAVSLFFLKEALVRAAFMMGRPKERARTIALIQRRTPTENLDTLADPSAPLPEATA